MNFLKAKKAGTLREGGLASAAWPSLPVSAPWFFAQSCIGWRLTAFSGRRRSRRRLPSKASPCQRSLRSRQSKRRVVHPDWSAVKTRYDVNSFTTMWSPKERKAVLRRGLAGMALTAPPLFPMDSPAPLSDGKRRSPPPPRNPTLAHLTSSLAVCRASLPRRRVPSLRRRAIAQRNLSLKSYIPRLSLRVRRRAHLPRSLSLEKGWGWGPARLREALRGALRAGRDILSAPTMRVVMVAMIR